MHTVLTLILFVASFRLAVALVFGVGCIGLLCGRVLIGRLESRGSPCLIILRLHLLLLLLDSFATELAEDANHLVAAILSMVKLF